MRYEQKIYLVNNYDEFNRNKRRLIDEITSAELFEGDYGDCIFNVDAILSGVEWTEKVCLLIILSFLKILDSVS